MSRLTGKPSPGQEALSHTREIQHQLKVHLSNLEIWGPQFGLEVNVPAMYVNDADHTATIEWGTNLSQHDADILTNRYAADHLHPRLEVIFLGNVNVTTNTL